MAEEAKWVVHKKFSDGSEEVVSGHDAEQDAVIEADAYPRDADEVVWVTSPKGDTIHTLKTIAVAGKAPN